MEVVKIKRQPSDAKQTLGVMIYNGKEVCKTLELAWNENNNRISCIPKGSYNVVRRTSPKHGNHFHITNVPKRDMILIHSANYHYQLLGCIAVGKQYFDLNSDGFLDITSSKQTLSELLKILPTEFTLVIE